MKLAKSCSLLFAICIIKIMYFDTFSATYLAFEYYNIML